MKIKRVINGKTVVIPLTDNEVIEIYNQKKAELASEQVHDYLSAVEVGDIFRIFGTETDFDKFTPEQMEKLEDSILQDRDLLSKISAQFDEYQNSKLAPEYYNDLDDAINEVLNKWAEGRVFEPAMYSEDAQAIIYFGHGCQMTKGELVEFAYRAAGEYVSEASQKDFFRWRKTFDFGSPFDELDIECLRNSITGQMETSVLIYSKDSPEVAHCSGIRTIDGTSDMEAIVNAIVELVSLMHIPENCRAEVDCDIDNYEFNKMKYKLLLCEGEPEEEVVEAFLDDSEVETILKDMAGQVLCEKAFMTVDGRKIDTGIVDEICDSNGKKVTLDLDKMISQAQSVVSIPSKNCNQKNDLVI